MKALTQKQSIVLDFVKEYIIEHKFPPTMREIARHFSMSVRGAHDHIKAMEKKGYIRRSSTQRRAMEVIDFSIIDKSDRAIPILGVINAGAPVNSEECPDGTVMVPANLLRPGRHFALKVKGDSMIEAGIMEGDTAIIQERNVAENGEIVVAMLDDLLTLKRYFKESNRIRLQAENPRYSAIYTQDIRILGRLAHIIRTY